MSKTWTFFVSTVLAVSASGVCSSASAQQIENTGVGNFDRTRSTGVLERPRPDYEALGVHAGGFLVYPRLTVDAVYDDNIFSSRLAAVGDTIFRIGPELAIKSNWSRHEVDLIAHAKINQYLDHSRENTTDYGVGGLGRLDVVRGTNLTGGVSYDRNTEPRTDPTAPTAALQPVRYDLSQFNIGGSREINRLRLQAGVNFADYNYDNVASTAGTIINQKFRDRAMWTENARADYAVSPDTALYVTGGVNQRDYRFTTLPAAPNNRSSTGYEADVGANFDLTNLVRGEVQVGYLQQSYKGPAAPNIGGVAFMAGVDWFPTPLTTVRLSGSRTVEEATVIGASGFIASRINLRVDHELLRNVILNANVGYENDGYHGVTRTDNLVTGGVAGTYLLNRNIGLRLAYDHLSLDSSGTIAARVPSYQDNKVTGSLTLQF